MLKLSIFQAKIARFVLSHQNASICIRMHQNVCRMNCANVLCIKLSMKWILLQFNRLKLKNYLYLFVMEDPVVASKNSLGNALNMCIFKTSSVKESMKNGTNSRYYAHNEISLKFVIIERFSKNLHFKALLLCAQKSWILQYLLKNSFEHLPNRVYSN